MSFEKEIKWLEDYNKRLEEEIESLDKRVEANQIELKELRYNIRENKKLIKKYQKAK